MDKTNTMTAAYQIVEGTRTAPGRVVKTFPADRAYKCGGPATACLRAWDAMRRDGVAAFFRKVGS